MIQTPGGDCRATVFQAKLRRMGFKSVIAPAKVTAKGNSSGGVCIAWRGHLNVTAPELIHPHRAVGVMLHTHSVGDVFIASIYGDVEGT